MGSKTTVWIFQETSTQNLKRENLDMAKKWLVGLLGFMAYQPL